MSVSWITSRDPETRRRKRRAVLLVLLAVALGGSVLGGIYATRGSGGPPPPAGPLKPPPPPPPPPAAPKITSAPADPTNQTSATFAFNSKGATSYLCSTDVAPTFAACTSPTTYSTGTFLEGSHSFQVKAVNTNGTSDPSSYSWTVDTTAPTVVSITADDPSPTTDKNVSWTVTFDGPVVGVDAHDFQLVVTGLGGGAKLGPITPGKGTLSTTFSVTASTGGGIGSLGLYLINDGSIKDAAGNPLTGTFPFPADTSDVIDVDHVVPPMPVFTIYPSNPSNDPSPTFAWTDTATDLATPYGYQCSIEDGPFYPCNSPQVLGPLFSGNHEFEVRAIDAAGNVSKDNEFHWKISNGITQPLTISGDASGPLYPGATSATPIPVTFTNSNSAAVTVSSLTITATNLPGGCSVSDFTIDVGTISPGTPLTVPANSSVTLPSGAVSEPTILMTDSGGPQNDCVGTFTLSYDGSNTNIGHATVGPITPFTVSLGTVTGGPLLPTALGDSNATIDTVPVTVTNNDPGAERLQQLVFAFTPGWTAGPPGPDQCDASDFSIDAQPAGTAVTVPSVAVPDAALPTTLNPAPGAGSSYTTSFTIQMVDNGHNQNACIGAHPSITITAG